MNNIIIISTISMLLIGCNGDYKKDLGSGYSLLKTNASCVYIFSENEKSTKIDNVTFTDNRIIKPMVVEVGYSKQWIVGYKNKNLSCYLDSIEVENPNGYFFINKKNNLFIDGLNKKEYTVFLEKNKISLYGDSFIWELEK